VLLSLQSEPLAPRATTGTHPRHTNILLTWNVTFTRPWRLCQFY